MWNHSPQGWIKSTSFYVQGENEGVCECLMENVESMCCAMGVE